MRQGQKLTTFAFFFQDQTPTRLIKLTIYSMPVFFFSAFMQIILIILLLLVYSTYMHISYIIWILA